MAYKVIFAGNPLHNYMNIRKIERTILPSRENSSKSIPATHGSYYLSYKYSEKEISLECDILGTDIEDYMEKIETIADLLDVNSPSQLILSDKPDKYVLAVPDGDFTVEKKKTVMGFTGVFTIKFKCFVPFEFARVAKNTMKSSMAKIGGIWVTNFEDSNDVEEGEIDNGYKGDDVLIGEGDDNEINYSSDEFETGFMDNYAEDYTPPTEDGFVEEQTVSALDETTNDNSDSLLLKSHQHILNFYNTGSVSTYPIISANFQDKANFFSCTNHQGKTVLIGTLPSLELNDAVEDEVVLNDTCTSLVDWTVAGNVLDDGRTITGNLGINPNGYAITCSNYGSDSNNWHGGAGRRNLSKQITDFRVEVEIEHESSGELGNTSNATSTTAGWYKVTGASSINQRKGRGSNYTLIQKIPKGKKLKISNISKKWGQCTYNGKTGYVYMSYLTKTTAPSTTSSDSNSSTTSTTYKTSARINIRKGRGTNYSIVGKIPKGKLVKVTSIKNGWGYVSYNGNKGYVYMKNLKKTSSSSVKSSNVNMLVDEYDTETVTREDRKGMIEVYGFDATGKKLWKMVMKDVTGYFEYSRPEIFVGGSLVVEDDSSTPTITRKTVTEDKKKVTYKVDSGSWGGWNSFEGKFTIERRTINNQQKWSCKVQKFEDGKATKTAEATVSSSDYPTEDLASIVIWFGQYKNETVVDTQNICNIKVTDLAPAPVEEVNEPIFKAGDELTIDFDEQTVELNGVDFLEQLDVGSEFFDVPTGMSEVLCQSNTDEMYVVADYRERWI